MTLGEEQSIYGDYPWKYVHPKLLSQFIEAVKPGYHDKLDQLISSILKDLKLPLAHQKVIYHSNKKT